LTNVDDCQNEESDAEDHVEDANHNMIAWFATIFAASTYKEGFQELHQEHEAKEDKCDDPCAHSQSKRVGSRLNVAEG
jgi:hypothetical protein